MGSASYPMSCPNLLSLLKQIGLGFLLTATKLTCTEIFPVAFMLKSRFLATVTKLFRIQCLFIPPSQLNTFTSCFIFQSYLAIFSTSYSLRLGHAVFSLLVTLLPPHLCLAGPYLAFGYQYRYVTSSRKPSQLHSCFSIFSVYLKLLSPSTNIRHHSCLATCLSSFLDFELCEDID